MLAEFPSGEGSPISTLLEQRQKNQEKEEAAVLQTRPEIAEGVNLVSFSGERPVFQSIVADEIQNAGKAVWIDSGNNCSTYALRSAGTEDLMRRVEIARCFTPFQHLQTIEQLEDFIDERTELLVAPEVSLLYEDGQLNEYEAEELFRDMWDRLNEIVEEHDLKLLVSVNGVFSYIVEGAADSSVEIEETSQGARYSSNRFETLVYHRGNYMQTTVPYWRRKVEVSARGQDQRHLQKSP